MITEPKISIIIPCYNRADLFNETLKSVSNQIYSNWECIVVDDGSTDNSENVALVFCKDDPRYQYHKRPNIKPKGANACRNYGLALCKGEYVVFLDSDDLLDCKALKERVIIASSSNCDMVVSHSLAFREKVGDMSLIWNKLNKKESNEDLLIRFFNVDMPWCTNAVLWKKNFLIRINGWNENLVAWQDWDIHVRALLKGAKIEVIDGFPDNYIRYNALNNIGGKYNTKQYYVSLGIMIKSVFGVIKDSEYVSSKDIYCSYEVFVMIWCIQKPIMRSFKRLPFITFFRMHLFKFISIFKYFKVYFIEIVAKTAKKSNLISKIFNKSIRKQSSYLKVKSTHYRFKLRDIKIITNNDLH
jgi:glycosyltransferase involved in cell wall biosynthesis